MRNLQARRRGLTLVELLVVILIIGALMSLLLPAIAPAFRTTYRAGVTSEISVMTNSLVEFRNKAGQFPVSRFICSENGNYSPGYLASAFPSMPAAELQSVTGRTIAFVRSTFPRVVFSTSGPVIPTAPPATPEFKPWYDFNGNGKVDPPYILTGDECLVFFLGGLPEQVNGNYGVQGFADNPSNPFFANTYRPYPTSKPTERATYQHSKPRFDFKPERLFDVDGDGVPSYSDFMNAKQPVPYAYFCPIGEQYDPNDVDFDMEPSGSPSPLGAFAVGPLYGTPGKVASRPDLAYSKAPNPYTTTPALPVAGDYETGEVTTGGNGVTFYNKNTFQIVVAGYDQEYGPGGFYNPKGNNTKLPYPQAANDQVTGATTDVGFRQVERDNQTNFVTGTLD